MIKTTSRNYVHSCRLVLIGFFVLARCSQTFAQAGTLKSPVHDLEYSLKSLYESASEVAKKNKWLQAEIEKMEQETTFLQEELQTLDTKGTKKRISTALDDREIMDTIPWDEKRLNTMYEDYIELDEENTYLKDRLLGKQNDQKGIEASIEGIEKELTQLTKQKEQLQPRLNKRVDHVDINRIKDTLERSKKSLSYAERKYKRLEKKFGRPLVQFTKIKDKNIELKGRAAYLSNQLQNLEAESASVEEQIHQIKATDENMLGDLKQDIHQLKEERKALLLVLERASKKLGSEFSVPDYDEEVKQIISNIYVIQEDNVELKKELNRLEEKIRATP